MNIYAPNTGEKTFYKSLHEKLKNLEGENICLIGDFNAIMDQEKDRSIKKKRKMSSNLLPGTFWNMAEQYNLINIWRTKNDNARNYTFFSNRHKTWTRLDMIWITAHLAPEIERAEILQASFADHNPVTLELRRKSRSALITECIPPTWTMCNLRKG